MTRRKAASDFGILDRVWKKSARTGLSEDEALALAYSELRTARRTRRPAERARRQSARPAGRRHGRY